ncbi:unnamed protein product, partial [Symbiodinium microadriaticum]
VVEADPRIFRDVPVEDPIVDQIEKAIRISAVQPRTWMLAGVFLSAVAEGLLGKSSLTAEQAARRARLFAIASKLTAKAGRRRDALARELDMLEEGQQGPKELEVEMISPLSKVSFRNFSVDLSDQPASPTHAATEFLRGALAKTPIDLEELSMALEQAKRADVDSMLLLRGEDVFMELIEKQAAVTRLATALQNRMLKDLRQAIAKAEASKIGPDEFPDASGCGIVKRAKAVVEQEELAAMEELRRSLNAG